MLLPSVVAFFHKVVLLVLTAQDLTDVMPGPSLAVSHTSPNAGGSVVGRLDDQIAGLLRLEAGATPSRANCRVP